MVAYGLYLSVSDCGSRFFVLIFTEKVKVSNDRGLVLSEPKSHSKTAMGTQLLIVIIGVMWNFADQSGRQFFKLGFVYFHESKTCGTYRPRTEDEEHRIRNYLTDALRNFIIPCINIPRHVTSIITINSWVPVNQWWEKTQEASVA